MQNKHLQQIALIFTIILLLSAMPNKQNSPIPEDSRQLLLVITDSETAVPGKLYRFQREDSNSAWQLIKGDLAVVIGKNGLGWGKGIHPETAIGLPNKKEGDGKSPAGIFTLSAIFGYAPPEKMTRLKLPYIHITEMIECVDDANSALYNRIVKRNEIDRVDWKSSEKMHAVGEQYELGVFVDHNAGIPQKGSGSCIFLHIWGGADDPTVGCTAMSPENMHAIAFWLDAAKNPILVQLTKALYEEFRSKWHLPEI